MVAIVRRCLPLALVVGASAWIAFGNEALGDYPLDGELAVSALARGDVSAYLSTHVMMGPFSTLVQAPFAAVAGGAGLVAYQWACLPGLLAVGLLGLYLARLARRRGMPGLGCWAIAALCLVNPLTFVAISSGHPEELLTAALAIGAVAVAANGHGGRAAVLLGLAVASKQWAVLAILPTLMAMPHGGRIRAALGAAAIVVTLLLPGAIASPDSFFGSQREAASTGSVVDPWSVWYPLADVTVKESTIGSVRYSAEIHRAPAVIGALSHPLIVFLVFALPVALALRRGSFGISGADAMALLALLALLRCALDPVSNLYYHLPLLLALVGWDALEARRWPMRAFAGAAAALAFDLWSRSLTDVVAFNIAYVSLATLAAFAVAGFLFGSPTRREGLPRGLDVRLTPAP